MLLQLKEATQTAHHQAEINNLARFIMDHTITDTQYKSLLLHNYQAYYAIESYINEHQQHLPDLLQNLVSFEKSNKIKKDLQNLSVEIPSVKNFEIAKTHNIRASVLGAMYVMEGSMMGGMLLAKHLKNCKNLSQTTSIFYGGDPKAHRQRWTAFKEGVDSVSCTQQEIDVAVTTAQYTFSLF